jgi:hypothetical protein
LSYHHHHHYHHHYHHHPISTSHTSSSSFTITPSIFAGLRIGGLSGIFNQKHYRQGDSRDNDFVDDDDDDDDHDAL